MSYYNQERYHKKGQYQHWSQGNRGNNTGYEAAGDWNYPNQSPAHPMEGGSRWHEQQRGRGRGWRGRGSLGDGGRWNEGFGRGRGRDNFRGEMAHNRHRQDRDPRQGGSKHESRQHVNPYPPQDARRARGKGRERSLSGATGEKRRRISEDIERSNSPYRKFVDAGRCRSPYSHPKKPDSSKDHRNSLEGSSSAARKNTPEDASLPVPPEIEDRRPVPEEMSPPEPDENDLVMDHESIEQDDSHDEEPDKLALQQLEQERERLKRQLEVEEEQDRRLKQEQAEIAESEVQHKEQQQQKQQQQQQDQVKEEISERLRSMESFKVEGAYICQLCPKTEKHHKTKEDFAIHLTFIHYKEQILKQMGGPPYKCLECNFVPLGNKDLDQMCDDLVMHYGFDEEVSFKLYEKDLREQEEIAAADSGQGLTTATITCQICGATHESKRSFVRHLSVRHYTQMLCEDLPKRRPFTCTFIDCGETKTNLHNLMLHHGCDHNVSLDHYKERYNFPEEMDQRIEQVVEIPKPTLAPLPEVQLSCKYCTATFVTRKSFNVHLFTSHFQPDLPKEGPYNCSKCSETCGAKTAYILHCINIHLEQFMADFELSNSGPIKASSPSPAVRNKDPRRAAKSLITTVPSAKKTSGSLFSPSAAGEKSKKPSSGTSSSSSSPFEAALSAANRFKKTVHKPAEGVVRSVPGELTARQRMMVKWESTSYEPQKARIEELEEQIQKLQDSHVEAMKKKGEDFEKWITCKENSITQECRGRQEAEKQLQKFKMDNMDLEKQLQRNVKAKDLLEETLAEQHALNHKTSKEKKALEKKLTQLESSKEAIESQSLEKDVNLEKLNEQVQEMEELKVRFGEKEEALAETTASLAKLQKQVEHHKSRADKLAADKKAKVAELKQQAKKFKESENDLVRKIKAAEDEKKASNSQQLAMKKELKKIEKSAESGAKLQQVTEERDGLLDMVDNMQKAMERYEATLTDKGKELDSANGRLEDLENNLEEALVKLHDQKVNDKERKELNSLVKRLQTALQDYEKRQFSQLNLISGLEKEKGLLSKKIQDIESHHSGSEDDLSKMTTAFRRKEKELEAAELDKDKAETRLQSVNEELSEAKNRSRSLDDKVKELERELRRSDADDLLYLKNRVMNLESEIKHLRQTHNKMKTELTTSNSELKGELSKAKERNHKFENDFSKLGTDHETLKTAFKDNHRRMLAKQKVLEGLQSENKALEQKLKVAGKFPPAPATPPPRAPGQALVKEESLTISPEKFNSAAVKEEPLDEECDIPSMDIPDSSYSLMDQEEHSSSPPPPPSMSHKSRAQQRVDTTSQQLILQPPSNAFLFMPADEETPPPQASTSSAVPTAGSQHLPTGRVCLEGGSSYTVIHPPSKSRSAPVLYNPVNEPNSFSLPAGDVDPLGDLPDLDPPPAGFQQPRLGGGRANMATKKTASRKRKTAETAPGQSPYVEEDDESVVCGICQQYDPPLPDHGADPTKTYSTKWIGCECGRWFHCQCTKLTRHTTKFSCRSVKMKCLKKN